MRPIEAEVFVPEVIVTADAAEASVRAALEIATLVREKPRAVLGLATGGTPVECYRELARMHREEGLDFSAITTFNLDEYVCLPPTHPQSYRHFMNTHLFDHINVPKAATFVPSGIETDMTREASDYEQKIRVHGGIDLQLLGLGHNGHIAFNEPGTNLNSRTRVVSLTAQTIESNSRFFDSPYDVPKTAISMGIETILEAKRIVLLATGKGKAEAVFQALHDEISSDCPATFLRLHPQVLFILDADAASRLQSL